MKTSNAEMSGWLRLRPVRIGLVFEPTVSSVMAAVKLTTTSWGGIYFPFISPTNKEAAFALANGLDVDVLHAIDTSGDSDVLSRTVGYAWKAGGDWGPFGSIIEHFSNHVQTVEWLYDEDPSYNRYSLPEWEPDHPLANVFAVMYGLHGEDGVSRQAASLFRSKAYAHNIDLEQMKAWPYDPKFCTPIQLTSREIEYTGEGDGPRIVVLRADDAVRLCMLWNLRASGHHICPWVIGHDEVSNVSLGRWLDHALSEDLLPKPMRGDGVRLGPHVSVHLPEGMDTPPDLAEELRSREIAHWGDRSVTYTHGWRGQHPLETSFHRFFKVESSRRSRFEIPMPSLGNAHQRRGHHLGFVIADVAVSSVTDLTPDLTMVAPAARSLDPLVDTNDMITQRVHRVTHQGRAVAVRADNETVELAPISAFGVIQNLMSGPGWSYRQTDGGRFSTRLIERLGGGFQYIANQPAVRAMLTKTAASHGGLPMSALLSYAKQYRGAWPDSRLSRASMQEYATNIARYLLSRKALHPILPLRCPECTAKVAVRPEDLRSDHTCDLCGSQTPLGLALSMNVRNDWSFRLPADIPPEKLSETLPVMAVLSILGGHLGHSADTPYALGVEVESPDEKFEVDLVMVLSGSYPPTMIIAEVKSFRDVVSSDDLSHLCKLQQHLRSKGVDCYIIAATLREELPSETVMALRSVCENTPRSIGTRVLPILPIVLTGRNLSVPYMHENNPSSWLEVDKGLSSIAVESCRRHLGMTDISYRSVGERKWVPTWQD